MLFCFKWNEPPGCRRKGVRWYCWLPEEGFGKPIDCQKILNKQRNALYRYHCHNLIYRYTTVIRAGVLSNYSSGIISCMFMWF